MYWDSFNTFSPAWRRSSFPLNRCLYSGLPRSFAMNRSGPIWSYSCRDETMNSTSSGVSSPYMASSALTMSRYDSRLNVDFACVAAGPSTTPTGSVPRAARCSSRRRNSSARLARSASVTVPSLIIAFTGGVVGVRGAAGAFTAGAFTAGDLTAGAFFTAGAFAATRRCACATPRLRSKSPNIDIRASQTPEQ